METTISVVCPHCGNPIVVSVRKDTSGSVVGRCYRCAHSVLIAYSYDDYGVRIHSVI